MSDDWQLDKKTGSWKKVKKQKSQKDYYYNPRTGSFEKETLTRSKKSGRADNYNPVTGSFEKRLERKSVKVKKSISKSRKSKKVKKSTSKPRKTKKIKKIKFKPRKTGKPKKKTKSIKINQTLKMYGFEYDKEHYLNWLPEVEELLKAQIMNTEFANMPIKLCKTDKGKYWDANPIYPRSRNEFINKFFKNKTPKGLEGLWNYEHWGTIGIVREKSHYQMYDFNITMKNVWKKEKGAVESFFDGLSGEIDQGQVMDYHLCNGTKGGALIPTSKKNKFIIKVKGVFIVPSEDGTYTFAHEEQTHTGNLINNNLIEAIPPYGNTNFNLKRIWPEFTTEDDPNLPGTKGGSASGTGFFVDDEGHIITNYHVIAPCNNKQKIIYNNKEFSAKLIAKDKQLDLALLKISVKNKHFIKITNKPIKKLQSIIAAGYPGGKALSDDLKFTSGIISSLKGLEDNSTQIQIDAALNLGNSGGPIVDSKTGELAAVAVSILRNEIVEGINFGIKVSQVRDFLYANKIDTNKISKKYKGKNLNTILENATLYVFCN